MCLLFEEFEMSAFRSVASPVLGAVVLSGRAIKRGYPVVVRSVGTVAGAAVGVVCAPMIVLRYGASLGMRVANAAMDRALPQRE
jgi:hypothetical protein